ncbi:MAG: ABC transporter permease [Bauldia sp.]
MNAPTRTSSRPPASPERSAPSLKPSPHSLERTLRIVLPPLVLAALMIGWQVAVTALNVPHYILPSPTRIAEALFTDWGILFPALLVTLKITFSALALALIGGGLLAVLFAEFKWFEAAVYPLAVILQVTPIVAIAPLILVYANSVQQALLIVAWIVAFFPVLSSTAQGLKSADHNLLSLMQLYRASRMQTLFLLKVPTALPFFLTGLRIAGGLSLIAAVVAEFAAGSAGAGAGLAFRLLESGFRLNIPRLFAALFLLSLTGLLIFAATSTVSWLLLRRWHESAARRES